MEEENDGYDGLDEHTGKWKVTKLFKKIFGETPINFWQVNRGNYAAPYKSGL